MTAWAQVEAALDGILDRRWYTNHGPLAQRLEAECARICDVAHAIAVTNPTIGLIMMTEALDLAGDVLMSALAPPRCAQALAWAGLQPRFCDIDPATLAIDLAAADPGPASAALLATPGIDVAAALAFAAAHDLDLYADGQAGLTGPALIDLPSLGDYAGGACILTSDDRLAGRLRNIRSSYGAGPPVSVVRTANGRLSEAQAAMALLDLGRLGAEPPELAQCRAALPGRRVLPFGTAAAIVAADTAERDHLLAALAIAGLPGRAFAIDAQARHCPAAACVADRMLTVPMPGLAAAAHAWRGT